MTRKLKAGFVLLIGASAGLISLQADVGLAGFGAATVAGLGVGAVLTWLAFPDAEDLDRRSRDPRRGRRR